MRENSLEIFQAEAEMELFIGWNAQKTPKRKAVGGNLGFWFFFWKQTHEKMPHGSQHFSRHFL